MSLIEQFFEVSDIETTIPKGMRTSLNVDSDDLKEIEATTASLDDERPYLGIGLRTSHPHAIVNP